MPRPRRLAAQKVTSYAPIANNAQSETPSQPATPTPPSSALSSKTTPTEHQAPQFPVLPRQPYKFDANTIIFADGVTIKQNDCVFLVLEPPGEPYFIGRVMGFEKKKNDVLLKANWFYRPRDILRHGADSRSLFATMHLDLCPVSTYRGHVTIRHRDEIEDLALFRAKPDHFYFDKLFDRYMIKLYDVLRTSSLVQLPPNYREALNKRFEYVFVEAGRGLDLLVAPKNCVKCGQWSLLKDLVECAQCGQWYHMGCLTPPLVKKPTRGYSWSCAGCSVGVVVGPRLALAAPAFEVLAQKFLEKDSGLTKEQRRAKEEWPFRYLGMHARLEDALDEEDRPYPRNSSRIGPKHQATVSEWAGHSEIYYDVEGKNLHWRHKNKKRKKDKEPVKKLELPLEMQNMPKKELPLYVKPRPKGYVERGLDDGLLLTLLWKQPPDLDNEIDQFIFKRLKLVAKSLGLSHTLPNFLDASFHALLEANFDFEKAYARIKTFTRQSLKEPTFSKEEAERFNEGVRQFGLELLPVLRHVKTQPFGMIVRYYYMWKKTSKGHEIWDNFPGRKNKRKKAPRESADPLGDPEDDLSYEPGAVERLKRKFVCLYCGACALPLHRWFRAPGFVPESGNVSALCTRCAGLWRHYAVAWEEPAEVLRKWRGPWKKRIEVELVRAAERALQGAPQREARHQKKRKPKQEPPPPIKPGKPEGRQERAEMRALQRGQLAGPQELPAEKRQKRGRQTERTQAEDVKEPPLGLFKSPGKEIIVHDSSLSEEDVPSEAQAALRGVFGVEPQKFSQKSEESFNPPSPTVKDSSTDSSLSLSRSATTLGDSSEPRLSGNSSQTVIRSPRLSSERSVSSESLAGGEEKIGKIPSKTWILPPINYPFTSYDGEYFDNPSA